MPSLLTQTLLHLFVTFTADYGSPLPPSGKLTKGASQVPGGFGDYLIVADDMLSVYRWSMSKKC